MNSVFIPFIPSAMTVTGLKYALEDHYGVYLVGIDMVANGHGYMFFAHFMHNISDAHVKAIDAVSQFKITLESGHFFYVRRNTGTLDLSDPAVTQILFYGDNTYSRGADKFVYTLTYGAWSIEWLPQEVIDLFKHRKSQTPIMTPEIMV